MAFSQDELDNIANAVLDYYVDKGNVYAQSLQDKPTLAAFDKAAKQFPGGKAELSIAVKGNYTTTVSGYSHNDTVSYANPLTSNVPHTRGKNTTLVFQSH